MATSIARLAVFLEADSSRLARDLDKAKKELKEWQDKVSGKTKPGAFSGAQFGGVFSFLGQGHARAFVALQGPLGVAAGLALTLVHKLVEVAKALDVIGKEADRLEIATQGLQSLHHAGTLAGVSTEELSATLDRFHRQLGAANSGNLEARRTFEDLGLSAQRLSAQGLDRSFEDVAEAIARIPQASERARISFELFGRQSARLDALLRGGRAGIQQARRELEAMGSLSSRGDIRDVERMNDAITTLQRGIQGGLERFTVEISPAVTRAVEEITGAVTVLTGAMTGLGRSARFTLDLLRESSSFFLRSEFGQEQIRNRNLDFSFNNVARFLATGALPSLLDTLTGNSPLRRREEDDRSAARLQELQALADRGLATPPQGAATTPISAQRDLARRALQEAGQLINSQRLSGAFQEGSSGAISAVNRFRIANSQQDRVVAAIEAGHRIQEQQRRELEDIRRILATGAFAQATF